jgi:hypothetical protein
VSRFFIVMLSVVLPSVVILIVVARVESCFMQQIKTSHEYLTNFRASH